MKASRAQTLIYTEYVRCDMKLHVSEAVLSALRLAPVSR